LDILRIVDGSERADAWEGITARSGKPHATFQGCWTPAQQRHYPTWLHRAEGT